MNNFTIAGIFTFVIFQFTYFTAVHAQFNNSTLVAKLWEHTTGTPDTIDWSASALDGSGNLIVVGNTMVTTNNTDMLITKYGTDGTLLWQVQYNHTNNNRDYGVAVAIDASDDIYVAGTSITSSGNGYDWVIQKYDDAGTLIWDEFYNGPGSSYDVPTDMVLDGAGSLFVVGASYGTSTLSDYCTHKYSASNGNFIWEARYNYTNLIDIPAAITLGSNARVYVTGGSASSAINWDFATVKYNTTTGAQVTVTRNSSSGLGLDHPTAITKDQYDNIYVTGAAMSGSQFDIKTVKLDDELNTVWSVTWDNVSLDDQANSIGVYANGYVYLTGYTKKTNGGSDFITIKYNASGTVQWEKFYSAPDETKGATARKLDISPYGDILVTGDVYNIGNKDFLTIAYDETGNIKWREWFAGIGNGDDTPMAVKVGVDNLCYVTGKVWTGTQYAYLTVKYQIIDYITPPDTEVCPVSFAYYENKGQLIDELGDSRDELKFYNPTDYPSTYFTNSKVHFQYDKHLLDSTVNDSSYRFEMKFSNSLNSKVYSADPTIPGYLNYYKPQCPDGAIIIRGRQYLLMKEIYRLTDVLYYANSQGLKMYFICKPGSDPSDIILNFNGASSTAIVSGKLQISTPLGILIFDLPTAYQLDANGDTVNVNWTPQYSTAGTNKISFSLGSYNAALPLIIKVEKKHEDILFDDCGGNCTWSTYYQGYDTEFFNVRVDNSGKIYIVGSSGSPTFKTSNGVIYFGPQGGVDAVVLKFESNGVRAWATYYGGSDNDVGYGIDIDASSNVLFTGNTSGSEFPKENPGGVSYYDGTFGGATDAYIVKINSFGTEKLWSTYFGGSGAESGNDLRIDGVGSIYIAGQGNSNTPTWNNISATYYEDNGGGFIAKFSALGDDYWATNFGSSTASAVIYAIDVDDENDLYVVGNVKANGLPTSGSYSNLTYRGGSYDGFAASFSEAGSINWCTYIGGELYDEARDCAIFNSPYLEFNNRLLVTGPANSTESTFLPLAPLSSGIYQDLEHNGTQNVFISEFIDNSGQCIWGTFYGSDIDLGQGITTDIDDRVYVTGRTQSTDLDQPSVDVNKFYFDDTYDEDDAFLLCFDKYRDLIWSTYFGGPNAEYGNSLTTFQNDKLYMVGQTLSTESFPLDDGMGVPYFHPTGNILEQGFVTRFDLDISFPINIDNPIRGNSDILISPNPTIGTGEISLKVSMPGKFHLFLRNDLGIVVRDFGEFDVFLNKQINLNLGELSKGIFFLELISKNSNDVTKLVVQ